MVKSVSPPRSRPSTRTNRTLVAPAGTNLPRAAPSAPPAFDSNQQGIRARADVCPAAAGEDMSTDRTPESTRWPRARKRLRSTPTASNAAGSTDRPRSTTRVASFRKRFDWAWIRARVAARGIPPGDIDDVAQEVVIAMSEAEPRLRIPPGKTTRRRATRGPPHESCADASPSTGRTARDEPTEVQAKRGIELGTGASAEEEALVHGPVALPTRRSWSWRRRTPTRMSWSWPTNWRAKPWRGFRGADGDRREHLLEPGCERGDCASRRS